MSDRDVPGSFRDPSGFLFLRDEVLYRQVNVRYRADYDLLMNCGLYGELVKSELLISHEEIDTPPPRPSSAYKVLRPNPVEFISYPYEWCFSQLKDAALLTLEIQRRALARGMSLKDASAYNVQFHKGRPVFIDTLSFEKRKEEQPWVAYRQFCEHFLAPLALMALTDERLGKLLRIHMDGIPLDLTSCLLPFKSKWNLTLGPHIHLHAKTQKKYADSTMLRKKIKYKMSERGLLAVLNGLKTSVEKLSWKPGGTEWYDYYEANNNYGDEGLAAKEDLVAQFLGEIVPETVWDLGGNTGRFSRIAASKGAFAVTWDIDPGCVESNYCMVQREEETRVLPLLLDLTNPSPAIGWAGEERMSLIDRAPVDIVLALGLIHHLAISNNTPLEHVAKFFRMLSDRLVIEFIPKQDTQVMKLLATREDIFSDYTREGFESAFSKFYEINRAEKIPSSKRTLYLMTVHTSSAGDG